MGRTKVLDCTLRDGGYCNQWQFGYQNIKRIIQSLVEANVDMIECGFLSSREPYGQDVSKFNHVDDFVQVLPEKQAGKLFVAMVNYGDYEAEDIPVCNGRSIDGLRVAFHKKDMLPALEFCAELKEKGYKLFIQAMVSLNYSDKEFLDLIERVNALEPYAFYIVDSFGIMKKKSLLRLFYLTENNLKEEIWIGFHSHNNMQLAYSNAQTLIEQQTDRMLLIDCCIYGMGRGAGNLNTELFVEYLNEHTGAEYELAPLLNIIDMTLNQFLENTYWGYSLPNYLSAVHNAHPNYAGYLSDKYTLTVEAMDRIFSMMDAEKCVEFDREYIEELYTSCLDMDDIYEEHLSELQEQLAGKQVILLAPGKSLLDLKDRLKEYAGREDTVLISVNFHYDPCGADYIFVSNLRRFRELDSRLYKKCIVTSNISSQYVYLQTKYYNLLNHVEHVRDNAGTMAVRFLIRLGVKQVLLAGFDGYSHDMHNNYIVQEMNYVRKNAYMDFLNIGIGMVFDEYAKQIDIKFLADSEYRKYMKNGSMQKPQPEKGENAMHNQNRTNVWGGAD